MCAQHPPMPRPQPHILPMYSFVFYRFLGTTVQIRIGGPGHFRCPVSTRCDTRQILHIHMAWWNMPSACADTHFLQASFIFEIWKFYSHRNIENNTVLCHIAGFFFIVSILFVSLFGSVRHTVNCERHTHNALALEPSSLFSTSNVCVYVSCMYKISIYHTAASVWCYAYPAYAVLLFLTSYNMNNAAWMLLLMLIPHIHVHCASCTAYCVCVCVGIPREPNSR